MVVVIGVGNEFRRDDAASPAVVTSLRGRVPPGVELVLTDGEPTRLIEAWTAAALAVLVRRRPRRSAPPGPGAQREAAERVELDDAGAEPQVRRWRDVGLVQQRPRHAERAQHLQRTGMEDQRAGRPDRLRPPVDDPDDRAVGVCLQGQGQPGRARARHQDVQPFTRPGQPPPGFVPAQQVRLVEHRVAAQPGQPT